MSNIEKHQPQQGMQINNLADAMRYAEAMAGAGMIPDKFKRQPANILVAQEIAQTMGESTWVVMSELYFVGAVPTFSAKYMRARVRQAGHKLRESYDKETGTARAVIIRGDDPEFEHIAEWDDQKARDHGLLGKGHWKKNPELMKKNRAVSEVIREACYEVMAGIAYTTDEAQDFVKMDSQRMDSQPQPRQQQVQQPAPAQIPQPQGRASEEIRADFHAVKEAAGAYEAVGHLYNEAQAAGHAELAAELNAWAVDHQQLAQATANHAEPTTDPEEALTPEAVQHALDAELVQ